jgi:hypothetical protein
MAELTVLLPIQTLPLAQLGQQCVQQFWLQKSSSIIYQWLQMITRPDVGNCVNDDSYDHMTHTFPVVWCPGFMVVTPLFPHLSITFSNHRFSNCRPTINVGCVKITLDSFCGKRVFKINIQFCCHLCCSSPVIFRNNSSMYDDLFLSMLTSVHCSSSLMLASHDSCNANITLEIVTFNTSNNVVAIVTDAR